MKSIFLILLFFVSCVSKTKDTTPSINEVFTPIALSQDIMDQYIKILPTVLKKAQEFQTFQQVQHLNEQDYNTAFYQFLFRDPGLSKEFAKLGYTDPKLFGDFHYTVLEAYLLLLQDPNKIQEAQEFVPKIEEELNKSLIQQGREKNNSKLNERIKIMQENLDFYNNLVLMQQYVAQIQMIDAQ